MIRYDPFFQYFTYPTAYGLFAIMSLAICVLAGIYSRFTWVLSKRLGKNAFMWLFLLMQSIWGFIFALSACIAFLSFVWYFLAGTIHNYNPRDNHWRARDLVQKRTLEDQECARERAREAKLLSARPDLRDW